MELSVFWTDFAKEKLEDIYQYYKRESKSSSVAKKLVNSIIDYTNGLEK